MTDDEFMAKHAGLFDAADLGELAEAFDAAIEDAKAESAAKAPQKDGLRYSHNEDDANGHTISVYTVVMGGKEVMYVRVDTALTVSVPGLPGGMTAHPIAIAGTTGKTIETKGFGVMGPSKLGPRINGKTVQSYVLPRLPRLLGELYGV